MTTSLHPVTDKRCATCAFWQGVRTLEFRGTTLWAVKSENVLSKCIANINRMERPASRCGKWRKWEKIG